MSSTSFQVGPGGSGWVELPEMGKGRRNEGQEEIGLKTFGGNKKTLFFFLGVGNFHHPLNGGWKIYYTLENQRFGSDAFSLSIGWIFKFQLLRVYYFHSPLYFQGFISLSPRVRRYAMLAYIFPSLDRPLTNRNQTREFTPSEIIHSSDCAEMAHSKAFEEEATAGGTTRTGRPLGFTS